MDKVRCPNCRGVKRIAGLGGMIGDCNLCTGVGHVNAVERIKPVKQDNDMMVTDVMEHVASLAVTEVEPVEPDIKIDGKKALYKRKTAAK